MKRGILITLLSAIAGGLTAYVVVNTMTPDNVSVVGEGTGASMFRTVNLMQDNWPDFTYAAESSVDAVVYVKVTSTRACSRRLVRSLTISSVFLREAVLLSRGRG